MIRGPIELKLLEQRTTYHGSSKVVINGIAESRGIFLGGHLIFVNCLLVQIPIIKKFHGDTATELSTFVSIHGERTPSNVSCDIVFNTIKRTCIERSNWNYNSEHIKENISSLKI